MQTKPVHVYRLCTEGTIEERIQRRAEQKLYLDQMVNRGSTAGAEEMDKLSKSELLSMLKFGADRCARVRGQTDTIDKLWTSIGEGGDIRKESTRMSSIQARFPFLIGVPYILPRPPLE